MGAYISFSGILTFKAADGVRKAASDTPPERLLVETDAPYLAPVPHRGKACHPAHTAITLAKLAEIKTVKTDEMARITSENFFYLFKKAKPPTGFNSVA
jgi:TatD DNase family protein